MAFIARFTCGEKKESFNELVYSTLQSKTFRIVHFTVTDLVAKPLNRSEAQGDLVMICLYHNKVTFSLTPNQRFGN